MVFSSVFSGINMLRFMQSPKNHDLTQLLYPKYITAITCCFYRGGGQHAPVCGQVGGGAALCDAGLVLTYNHYFWPLRALRFFPYGGYPGNLDFFYQAPFYKIT